MRNLYLTTPEHNYLYTSFWKLGVKNAEADAVQYLAVIVWNGLFGWLNHLELACDHDGPHIYGNRSFMWYSTDMPDSRNLNNLIDRLSI